jgi:hypothetical protein
MIDRLKDLQRVKPLKNINYKILVSRKKRNKNRRTDRWRRRFKSRHKTIFSIHPSST